MLHTSLSKPKACKLIHVIRMGLLLGRFIFIAMLIGPVLIRPSFGESSDGSMMLRFLHDEPNVSERLSSGGARRSLADMEENCDNLLQQHGYKMRIAGEKL